MSAETQEKVTFAGGKASARRDPAGVVETFGGLPLILFTFCRELVKLG